MLQLSSSDYGLKMLFPVLGVFLIVGGGSLASSVIPNNYNVQFSTDIHSGSESYDGTVEICFNVTEEVDQLELHARNLTIRVVALNNKDEVYETQPSELPNGNLLLKLENSLPSGNYHLKVTFSGTASDSDAMFKGSYQKGDDESVGHYLMSKPKKCGFLESPSAFPHFGEEHKATFKLSVAHHESFRAWSNMPLEDPPSRHDREEYVVSSFGETPEMHVFDVGFFVADFGSKHVGKVTVVAREDILESLEYVTSVCRDLVKIMDNHTAVDYNVPDYALIVVPRKFSHSNLTEFERKFVNEKFMMYNPEEDDFNKLSAFLRSAGNNLMLQWFGDMIAPEEERLLQAFANVYTYYNAEKIYPHEFMMMHYQVDVVQRSLLRDYERPSSVLNMFWLMVLDSKWATVMENLSKNRQPRTLTTAQLCSEAQTLWKDDYNLPEGTTLESIFNQWMYSDEEPPVLNVQRVYSEGKVILSQNGSEKVLPYNFATKSSHFDQLGPFQWLTTSNETLKFDVPEDHWILFNKEQFGFYRVNYDQRNWELIIQALQTNASSIHRVSRMQLLDDALHFVKNDQLDVSILLNLLTYLRNETCYDVWYDAYIVLKTWYYREMDPPQVVKDFFVHIIEPYYQSFASQDINQSNPQMELHIQSKIADLACWFGKKDCLQQARSRFQQAVSKNIPVEPNWARMTYCYGLHNASDDELEWLLTKNKKQHSCPIAYLRCVDNEKHLRRALTELKKMSNPEKIAAFVSALDENGFKLFHSLLKNEPDLVQVLGSSTIELALERVSKSTKSSKTLKLIEDLEDSLDLPVTGKGSGSPETNIWAKPEAVEFIERYMAQQESR
ncbi:glutamyl aminopeptidase [Aedes aegypti]|uniref:Uncharacterized protein n=1 Tax=Aedes aegypti TaxID=7159 RepID=A0A1S4FDD2_AEDAE|nr:glutamyl aminopeptidase [Aedes aegypti]